MRRLGEYLGMLDEDGQWAKPDYLLVAVFFVTTVAITASGLPWWGTLVVYALVTWTWSIGKAALTRRRRPPEDMPG